jgi:hypothetical protein
MIVSRRDPSQKLARPGLTGDDGLRSRREFAKGVTPIIQSQVTLSRLFIRTMTQEAIFRQNRPNLFGEVDRRRRFGTRSLERKQDSRTQGQQRWDITIGVSAVGHEQVLSRSASRSYQRRFLSRTQQASSSGTVQGLHTRVA